MERLAHVPYLELSTEAAVKLRSHLLFRDGGVVATGQPMYLEGEVVATRPAHVPGRGSGGYKASPCTWKWEQWLQGQPM
jgi:hypothetical protein